MRCRSTLRASHPAGTSARRSFENATDLHGSSESITIDRSGANTDAVLSLVTENGLVIKLRQRQTPRQANDAIQDLRVGAQTNHWPRDHALEQEGAKAQPCGLGLARRRLLLLGTRQLTGRDPGLRTAR